MEIGTIKGKTYEVTVAFSDEHLDLTPEQFHDWALSVLMLIS
jgi:hypothetical protein